MKIKYRITILFKIKVRMKELFNYIKFGNKRLLIKNKNNYDYNIIYNQYTPLTYAVSKRMYNIIKLIVEYGADINKYDNNYKKTIDYACENNDMRLIYYLKNETNCDTSWEDIIILLLKKEYYESIIDIIKNRYICCNLVLNLINLEKLDNKIFNKMILINTKLDVNIFNKLYTLNLGDKLNIYVLKCSYTDDILNIIIQEYSAINIDYFINKCNVFNKDTINMIVKSDNKTNINSLLKKTVYLNNILYYSILNHNQYGIDNAIKHNADYVFVMNYIIKNKLL